MDFLPAADWATNGDDAQFRVFIELLDYLKKEKKLIAKVDVDVESVARDQSGVSVVEPGTISLLSLKTAVKKAVTVKTINRYSKAIGHDVRFELVYGAGAL